MKKILVLIMSCELGHFKAQEEDIRNTWLKDVIDKKYPNIDYLFYSASEQIPKHKYTKETHRLLLRCEDDIHNTFKKTYYSFKLLERLFGEYDYVIRTNTSTYINIELANEFIQSLDNDEILWTSECYSLSNAPCPMPLDIYGRGNGLILSKKIINIILKEGISHLYFQKISDDEIIGNIMNSYWIKQGKDYLDYIKSYKHGWYKCIETDFNVNHKISSWGDSNDSWDHIKQFITLQIRSYSERRKSSNDLIDRDYEQKHYIELYNIFNTNKYSEEELKSQVSENFEYSKNPSIFIGSILGYIDLDDWKKINKMNLFNYEINHKARNDEVKDNEIYKKWF